jgi:hypothetical protein
MTLTMEATVSARADELSPAGLLAEAAEAVRSGPLRRRHHRWKTHGGHRCRQAGPERHLWQTPHGPCFLVDHTGTRALTPEQAETILAAPSGVEIYWP